METAMPHPVGRYDGWRFAWQALWRRLAPRCAHSDCIHSRSVWRRLRGKPRGVVIHGLRYCKDACTERAVLAALRRLRSAPRQALAPHRIPLGLLLLSRQQLTAEQLQAALQAQRSAGHGRIGEWLQSMGFVSEQQVTAALARQWSCPVLRVSSVSPDASHAWQIPITLLESFVMIPVDYVESTATLHIAFGEGVDYRVLYAIEQMVGCHTQSCMAVPSFVRQKLQALTGRRGESEVVFDRVADDAEFSRIIRSYCVRLAANEIRLVACGPHVWVRLLCRTRPSLDLLLPAPGNTLAHSNFPFMSTAI